MLNINIPVLTCSKAENNKAFMFKNINVSYMYSTLHRITQDIETFCLYIANGHNS